MRRCFTALAIFFVFMLSAGAVRAETLKIGSLPAADSVILHVAADEGLFAARGLEVEIVPFQSALELGAAMRAGELAGHFGDLLNVLMQNERGARQAVIATTTHSSPEQRCFALAVSPKRAGELKGLADMKGTDTAMSGSTIIDYLLWRMSGQEKLPESWLNMREVRQIPVRLQMLLGGMTDSALLPEPLATMVETRGARTVWDDTGLDEPLAVIALRAGYLKLEVVEPFRAALREAARRIDADRAKDSGLMVDKGLMPKAAAASYKMVRFDLFGTPDGMPPLPTREDMERVEGWMMSRGMLKSSPAYEEIIFPMQSGDERP